MCITIAYFFSTKSNSPYAIYAYKKPELAILCNGIEHLSCALHGLQIRLSYYRTKLHLFNAKQKFTPNDTSSFSMGFKPTK